MAEATIVNGMLTIPRSLGKGMVWKYTAPPLDDAGHGDRFMNNVVTLLGQSRVVGFLLQRVGEVVARPWEVIAAEVEELLFQLFLFEQANSGRVTQPFQEQICTAATGLVLSLCRGTSRLTFPPLPTEQEEAIQQAVQDRVKQRLAGEKESASAFGTILKDEIQLLHNLNLIQ